MINLSFKGRASVSEYWMLVAKTRTAYAVSGTFLIIFSLFGFKSITILILLFILVPIFLVELSATVRRLHDSGLSASFFIPSPLLLYVLLLLFGGPLFLFFYQAYLLKMLVVSGAEGVNEYGDRSAQGVDAKKAKNLAFFAICVLGWLPILAPFLFLKFYLANVRPKSPELAAELTYGVAAVGNELDKIVVYLGIMGAITSFIYLYFLLLRKDVITYDDYIKNSEAERQKRIENLYNIQEKNKSDRLLSAKEMSGVAAPDTNLVNYNQNNLDVVEQVPLVISDASKGANVTSEMQKRLDELPKLI